MIYLSLGSNIGNRLHYLREAVEQLKKHGLKNVRYSMVLETPCILPPNAPPDWNKPFLNMIVSGETQLAPPDFLLTIKNIETQLGRPLHYQRWSPRVIDIDILLWDDLQLQLPELIIPHPQITQRPFLQHLLALMNVPPWTQYHYAHSFTKAFVLYPQLVGILNVTPDSFSDGGKFYGIENAVQQALALVAEGASILEIGVQSTRPGAILHSPQTEYCKLKEILAALLPVLKPYAVPISIDTFWPTVIVQLLNEYNIAWINDVKGELDDYTLRTIAEHQAKLCCMHSLGIPPSADKILPVDKTMENLLTWGMHTRDKLLALGFSLSNIVLDPGIGFGKSMYQNIEILRQAEKFKTLNTAILMGHSRKSYLNAFTSLTAAQRDVETLAVSSVVANKVDFLRVHNVADHNRFFATLQNF